MELPLSFTVQRAAISSMDIGRRMTTTTPIFTVVPRLRVCWRMIPRNVPEIFIINKNIFSFKKNIFFSEKLKIFFS